MKVLVEDYPHRRGEHCASTAIRNVLDFHGVELSEPMILGLSSGLGFFYIRSDQWSPPRLFHGRTTSLEEDFCRNTGVAFSQRSTDDDPSAWRDLRAQIDSGRPALISTDTFYLGYHNTTSHFPGHRVVVVGYDEAAGLAYMADRKFDDYQVCSLDELRRSRNADDYPISCHNELIEFTGSVELRSPLAAAIRSALLQNCSGMLNSDAAAGPLQGSESTLGISGMRAVATDLPSWKELPEWSWAARFAYQVVIKRGAGGSFFRSLYADFLDEASESLPCIAAAGLPVQMHEIAAHWRGLAAVLKEQSEREQCAPELFEQAGREMAALADEEEAFFLELQRVIESDSARTPAPG